MSGSCYLVLSASLRCPSCQGGGQDGGDKEERSNRSRWRKVTRTKNEEQGREAGRGASGGSGGERVEESKGAVERGKGR